MSGLDAPKVVSADSHSVRVWEASTGAGVATVEPPEPGINDVLLMPNSGLFMLGCDVPQIQVAPLATARGDDGLALSFKQALRITQAAINALLPYLLARPICLQSKKSHQHACKNLLMCTAWFC